MLRSASRSLVRRAMPRTVSRTSLRPAVSAGLRTFSTGQVLKRATTRAVMATASQPCRFLSGNYPAHFRIDMPALSPTMESGTIVSWAVNEGDELGDGDLLAQIETDKATMDFETPEVGYLAKIILPAGTSDVKLGTPVCIIVENQEDIAAFADYTAEAAPAAAAPAAAPTAPPPPPPPAPSAAPPPPPAPPASPAPVAASPPSPAPDFAPDSRILASPMARTLAARKGIDLSKLASSGPDGVIRAADIEAAAAAATPAAAPPAADSSVLPVTPSLQPDGSFTEIPLTGMRKAIAKRLTQSKQEVPHYYLTIDIAIDDLLGVRSKLNAAADGEYKLSVTDFLIKACSKALVDVPEANSQWAETSIKQFHNADISVAVATDSGLITPIVFTANKKGLQQINTDMNDLKEKAVSGKLQPHEFQGGTFTISNLGMMGIDHFTAVINPPQSCILAVGSPAKKLVPADNEKGFNVQTTMSVSLSCDHRVVDGAVGAKWLAKLKSYLENPLKMLL